MRAGLLIFLCVCVTGIQQAAAGFQQFDKATYYSILKSGSIKEIDDEILLIDASALTGKGAFKGAMLMKKAGLLKAAKEKLAAFKSGRIQFETAYRADTSNVEYRFLRLIIQEHAPKVVKYNKEIFADAAFIKKNYKELSPEIQKILIGYSQSSKSLKPQDFQS